MLECRDPANAGVYEVRQDLWCYRKQALDELTGKDGWKAEPGQVLTVGEIDESVVTRPTLARFAATEHDERGTDASPAEQDHR